MKSIRKSDISATSVTIPGSKSISHRMLICASMASGTSTVKNLLNSDDIQYTMSALSSMGAVMAKQNKQQSKQNKQQNKQQSKHDNQQHEQDKRQHEQDKQQNKQNKKAIELQEGGTIEVTGFGGHPKPFAREIYLGNSGTSMRLIAGIAGLGTDGTEPYVLTGDDRMQERPMGDLLEALKMAGVEADSLHGNGTPPVVIKGGRAIGGDIFLDCSQSSQYLSAMLMMGAVLLGGLRINLPGKAVSAPYVDLTMDIMKQFGVKAERLSNTLYEVSGNQIYQAGNYVVEPDLSNASYFWAAGAVSGSMITVTDINKRSLQNSLQGDKRLLDIFRQMGCTVDYTSWGTGVCGADLNGVEVDMSDIPDVVPTLAVVASFAKGTTKVVNIEHLREKECDRISAVVSQLRKMGVEASEGRDWLSVTGCENHRSAVIETFNDHRIAMAFSIAGLRVQGIEIENEGCVAKSFPGYWKKFDSLGGI